MLKPRFSDAQIMGILAQAENGRLRRTFAVIFPSRRRRVKPNGGYQGDWSIFVTRPLSLLLPAFALLAPFLIPGFVRRRKEAFGAE